LKQTSGSGGKMPLGKLDLSDEDRALLDKMLSDESTDTEEKYKL